MFHSIGIICEHNLDLHSQITVDTKYRHGVD